MSFIRGRVSIIVPVYNVEGYIVDCIESIVAQDYTKLEIILVDDGSKDRSIDNALSYLQKYEINYKVVHQENRGLPAARNSGIKQAEGEFICFIDSDDRIAQGHIKALINMLERKKLDFAFSDFVSVNYEERIKLKSKKVKEKVTKIECQLLEAQKLQNSFLRRDIKIHCCAIMLRRNFVLQEGLWFDERLRFGEDAEFLWRVITRIEKGGYVKTSTYEYLNRPGSLMNVQKVDLVLNFMRIFNESIHKQSLNMTMQDVVYSRVILGALHSFARHSKYSTFKILRQQTKNVEMRQMRAVSRLKDPRWIIMQKMYKICPIGFYCASKVV